MKELKKKKHNNYSEKHYSIELHVNCTHKELSLNGYQKKFRMREFVNISVFR